MSMNPNDFHAIAKSFGAVLIGTFLGFILLGLTIRQAYQYTRVYPGDCALLKGFVALVMVLEATASALTMHVCYWLLVTNYFHPEKIGQSIWSTNVYITVSGATMVVSQSFFARRVWLLEPRYRPVVVISCLCSLAELGCLIVGSAIQFTIEHPETTPVFLRLVPTAFCLAMVADLLLTVSLIYILHCKRTGFKNTDSIIDVLILYSVSTGLLTGVFDLLTVISILVFPDDLLYTIFAIPGTKLYGIALLSALHSRRTVRGEDPSALQGSSAVFGVSFSPHSARDLEAQRSPQTEGMHTIQFHPAHTTQDSNVVELEDMSCRGRRSVSLSNITTKTEALHHDLATPGGSASASEHNLYPSGCGEAGPVKLLQSAAVFKC